MVQIIKKLIEPSEYNNINVRKSLNPFEAMVINLTENNKCFVKEVAGGTSQRTGKSYDAFKTYSIKAEHNGNDLWISLPNAFIAQKIEELSVGDSFEITCLPHAKGKTFIVEKIEEEQTGI